MKNLVSRNSQDGRRRNKHQNLQRKHPPNTLKYESQELNQDYLSGENDLQANPDQILHLQNVIGNQAVQRLIDPNMPKSNSGDAFLASFGVSSTAQRSAQKQNAETIEDGDDVNPVDGFHTPEIVQQSNLAIPKSPFQRKEMPDGQANHTQPDNITPFPAQNVSPAQQGDIQRGALAKQIGKHIGYGVLSMIAEQVIGPFADLKHVIRLGYYSRLKKGKTGTELTKIEDKEDKVKDNVSEEWIGDYQGETWMTVIHAMSTTSEKLAVLAGAIGLLATIASAFAPPAAVVATVAGIIGVSLTGLALIGRSILAIASLVKYNKAAAGPAKQKWKKMALGNLFKSISNVLGIVTFGIGAGVGGVDFSSGIKTGADIGTDIGIGTAGALVDIGVGEIQTPLDTKRLQREPEDEESKDESEAKETLMELDKVLEGVDGEMTDEKGAANEEKSKLQQDKGNLDKVDGKLGDVTQKTDEIKEQAQEAETEMGNAETQAEEPKEGGMSGISKGEVKELEQDVDRAEESIESEKAVGKNPDISKKKGFFARIKSAAKKAGKSFKRGFKKLFARLKSVFNRVKAIMQKAKAKITAMVLKVLGISESVAAAHDEVKDQKATQIPESLESIDEQAGTMDEIKEKIGELD